MKTLPPPPHPAPLLRQGGAAGIPAAQLREQLPPPAPAPAVVESTGAAFPGRAGPESGGTAFSLESVPPGDLARLVWENRQAARATETSRALGKNWRLFVQWCAAAGVESLPAQPNTVEAFMLYLSERHPVRRGPAAQRGLRPASVHQALWAVNTVHRQAGQPAPGDTLQIQTAMAGIRRRKGTRPRQQAPFTPGLLLRLPPPATLREVRNRALLLVGFAACLRRGELVGLRVEQLEDTPYGMRLLLPRSKTDQEGQGSWVDLVYAEREAALCAVQALREWLRSSGLREGALFPGLWRGGRLRRSALAPASVDAIIKEAALACGLNARHYGGHSLRAGCATHLAEQNTPLALIARHGRWKNPAMVLRYARGEVAGALRGRF